MKDWLEKFEKAIAVWAIMYHTNTFVFIFTGTLFVDGGEKGRELPQFSPVLSIIQWAMYFTIIALGCLRWKQFFRALTRRKCIWMVVILAFISISWSIVPDATFRRSLMLLMTTIVGMYIAFRFTVREQLYIVACALGLLGIMNLLFTLAFPAYALEVGFHQGDWRGLLPQKNQLGRLMVLSSIAFYILVSFGQKKHRGWAIAGLVLSVALVLLSDSKTALSVMIMLFVLIPLYRVFRLKYTQALPLAIGLLILIILLTFVGVNYWNAILAALGREPNLTGRTALWQALLGRIAERIWFGYGYQSFWAFRQVESLDVDYMAGALPHAHNGYLEMLLDMGLAGFVPFALSLFRGFARSIMWLRLNPSAEGVWPIAYLTYLLFYNVTETSLIVDPSNIFWLMFSLVTTSILIQPIRVRQSEDSDRTLLVNTIEQPIAIPERS